ncbi:helix-turn-helix domain-containing protein [Streptosporangium canum]|uniref:helix-turn-helix domain-containing protein n=1 Tax=Streptosporangium canum TaxID=324952 RepID=UPI0036B03BBB
MSDQLAYRPEQALRVFPIGRTTMFAKIKSGEIESFTVGRARFIPRKALVDFMQRQIADQNHAAG